VSDQDVGQEAKRLRTRHTHRIIIDCPYCVSASAELAAMERVCPKCGGELGRNRLTASSAWEREDAFDANPVEARYGEVAVTHIDRSVDHDAHEVLAYADGLLDVVSIALDLVLGDPGSAAVLGFMTGSDDLDWLLRRVAGHLLEGRLVHVRGLSHGTADADPKRELRSQLNVWAEMGVKRIVLIDEVLSGTQMWTALCDIRDWFRCQNRSRPLMLNLLGVAEARRVDDDDGNAWMRKQVFKAPPNLPAELYAETHLVRVPKLLALDKPGQPLKSFVRGTDGNYQPKRISPVAYTIRCPNRLLGGATSHVGLPGESLDRVFGNAIFAICGFGYTTPHRWPDTILKADCEDCRARLLTARKKAEAIASHANPPGDVCGSLFEHPDRRASALVDEAGKPLRLPDS